MNTTTKQHTANRARVWQKLIPALLLCLLAGVGARAQDLGPSVYSKLTWNHISTVHDNAVGVSASIGLTTDKRMYVWGNNILWTIHTNFTSNGPTIRAPLQQTAPFYLPSPAGETIKKVQVKRTASSVEVAATYFALSESGKLYAWGFNNGLLETAWPVPTGSPVNTLADTVRTKRTPTQLTILTESTFVDFDVSTYDDYWIAIGASGKAYHIGNNGVVSGGAADTQYTFAAIPNPAGVDNATFKYTRVWTYKEKVNLAFLFLEGNDGKLYYTGSYNNLYVSGIPTSYFRNTPTPTITTNELYGKVRVLVPKEVPFPAGEDIVKMEIGNPQEDRQTTYALTASGKVYMTGLWRVKYRADNYFARNYVVVPLKAAPLSADVESLYRNTFGDTTHVLKKLVL